MTPTVSPRPTIVCLCGSTRFSEAFRRARYDETLAGRIVLTIGCDLKSDDQNFADLPDGEKQAIKARLDELHLRKIDLADEVLILNVNGYVGQSTSGEIAYSFSRFKRVRWLEPDLVEGHWRHLQEVSARILAGEDMGQPTLPPALAQVEGDDRWLPANEPDYIVGKCRRCGSDVYSSEDGACLHCEEEAAQPWVCSDCGEDLPERGRDCQYCPSHCDQCGGTYDRGVNGRCLACCEREEG